MTITRITETEFMVVTDTVMTDGSMLSGVCRFEGQTLKTFDKLGFIRPGMGIRIACGPTSFTAISSLSVGNVYTR